MRCVSLEVKEWRVRADICVNPRPACVSVQHAQACNCRVCQVEKKDAWVIREAECCAHFCFQKNCKNETYLNPFWQLKIRIVSMGSKLAWSLLKDFGQTMQRILIYCEGTLNVLLPLRSALFFGNDWLSLILQPKTMLLKYNLDMPCGSFSCLRVYEQVFLMGPLWSAAFYWKFLPLCCCVPLCFSVCLQLPSPFLPFPFEANMKKVER